MRYTITRRQFGSIIAAAGPAVLRPAIAEDLSAAQGNQTNSRDVGSLLRSGKPYFPMLLGNGWEHVLIGYSGAMGACAGHEHWSYGTTYTGWFRPDTRTRPERGVLNLLQASYILRRGIHADGIDTAEQTFDAARGILITDCQFANAKVRVKTFLTRHHLLVHRFEVTTSADDMWMQFFVRTALPRGPLAVAVDSKQSNSSRTTPDRVLPFSIVGPDWTRVRGWLLSDHPTAKQTVCYNRLPGIEVPLGGTSEFTFVVKCDSATKPQESTKRNRSVSRFDYTMVLREHQAEWQRFDSRSSVRAARGELDDIYRTSLYTLRAHQHADTGGITVGAYPGMWSNGINSYDVSYGLMALLGANRMLEATKVVRFWKRILPILRERAEKAGLPGIACAAPISPWGHSRPKTREQILEERHFITANIGLHVWQLYQYSGRLQVLKDYWQCLAEPVKFLLGACVKEFPNHAEIIRSSGPNGKERVGGKVVYRPNPIRTLLATIEVVRAIRQAAKLLGKTPDPRWDRLLPKLERGVEANRFDGIVRASRSPQAPARADAAYIGLFDCRVDEKTLTAEIEHETGPEGFMRWPDHGYRAIAWSHLNVSAAWSRLGLPDAARMLEIAARFTTTVHGFPEAVRPDGVYSKTWYPTTHAAFVHALNLLLLRRRGDLVELFAGLPTDWGNASFQSLRVPLGLLVDASRTGNRVTAELTNDSEQTQTFRVRANGPRPWEKPVSLKPGETITLPS